LDFGLSRPGAAGADRRHQPGGGPPARRANPRNVQ
jgi:hypothetical protein